MKSLTVRKKIMVLLLTLCMVLATAMPAFAGNGPTSGEKSAAWVQLYSSETDDQGYSVESHALYSNSGKADTVQGASYDKATNTITLTNYNRPNMILATNEMGDDLKLKLVGENHVQSLVVWGYGWGGNLEILGNGSLTVNENKKQFCALRFMAEGTKGLLKVGSEATLTAYKGTPESPDDVTYSAAFLESASKTVPFQGNLQTPLTMTPESGKEGEYAEGELIYFEKENVSRTWQLATKDNNGKLYGVYITNSSTNQTQVYELIKVAGLPSGNEYLAIFVSSDEGTEWPEGYTKDPDGKTAVANISDSMTVTVLQKDGKTFYWGTDKMEFPPEGGFGTPWYSVYKGLSDKMEIVDRWGDVDNAVIAAPVEGMRNLTKDKNEIPAGYSKVTKKTGTFGYYCTNDVIKVVPGKAVVPGNDDAGKVKDLTYSDTGVSVSLTKGVPEGATLYADTMSTESVLGSNPKLKEELPGLLTVYQITVKDAAGKTVEVKNNPMTVKIPMTEQLKGYKYYQAVYLGDQLERYDAKVEGDSLVFKTTHLSQYAILGSNTPFETSKNPTGADAAKPNTGSNAKSPKTSDNSNMALWIALVLASCGGAIGTTVYGKRKKW